MSVRWIRFLVGISILFFIISHVDIAAFLGTFSSINPSWVILSLIAIIAASLLSAFNLHLLVNQAQEITFLRFIPIHWLSWAFNLIIPGQVGDLLTLSVLLRQYHLSWPIILGRTLVDKIISLLAVSLLALIGFFSIIKPFQWHLSFRWGISSLIVIGFLVTLFYLLRRNHWVEKSVQAVLSIYYEMCSTIFRMPGKVLINFLLTWVKIVLLGLAYWAMFAAFGCKELLFWNLLSLTAISSLAAYVPISLNGLGVVESVAILLFATQGIAQATILSVYLTLRVVTLLSAWIPGGVWLLTHRSR